MLEKIIMVYSAQLYLIIKYTKVVYIMICVLV